MKAYAWRLPDWLAGGARLSSTGVRSSDGGARLSGAVRVSWDGVYSDHRPHSPHPGLSLRCYTMSIKVRNDVLGSAVPTVAPAHGRGVGGKISNRAFPHCRNASPASAAQVSPRTCLPAPCS